MKLYKAGKTIRLRLVEVDDAKFVHCLRVDGKYNKHLSQVTGSVEDQRKWIESYKERENKEIEYYFIIERIDDDVLVGTVRLYDFIDEKKSFSWGSWILNEDKTRYSAIESAMLVYEVAFNELGFECCHFEVRKGNEHTIKFHQRFGAKIIGENEVELFFNLSKQTYINLFNEKKCFIE